MANIKIINKNNQEQTFVGVKVLTVNKEGGGVVNFTENPLLLDTSQNAPAQYEGMFCEDINTHGSYKVTRGTSGDFIVKSNFPDLFCCYRIIEANGLFVALGIVRIDVGNYKIRVYISNDGLTWTQTLEHSTSGGSEDTMRGKCDICYGNGIFIAYILNSSGYAAYVYTSNDATNWTQKYDSYSSFLSVKLAYGNGFFLAESRTSDSARIIVRKSNNGINWTDATTITISGDTSYGVSSLDYIADDGLFYLVKGENVYESSDGITWSLSSFPSFTGHIGEVFFKFNGYYFSGEYINSKNNIVKSQKNAQSWNVVSNSEFYPYSCCSTGDVLYIAGNAKIAIYNGTSFEIKTFTLNSSRGKIAINNGLIVMLRDQNSNQTTDYVISESSDSFYYRPIYY